MSLVPCLWTTTLPSLLLLVRAMRKPSTCIIGEEDIKRSASADPCWSLAGTATTKLTTVVLFLTELHVLGINDNYCNYCYKTKT